MEDASKTSISRELLSLAWEAHERGVAARCRHGDAHHPPAELAAKAEEVAALLTQRPYWTAQQVSEHCAIDPRQMSSIYQLIQHSQACQQVFRKSKNRDYFSVVEHYFNHHMYTLVFFVGNSCPSRCVYCPNVTTDVSGKRQLASYGRGAATTLDSGVIDGVVADLVTIRNAGSEILVKVSGGLEPLTDLPTVTAIVEAAKAANIRVKLFTNGLLLNTPAARTVALHTGDVRISLSTADEVQYQEICFSDQGEVMDRALAGLKRNIRSLVTERNATHSTSKIGFNSLVLPNNHASLEQLLTLASELGVDYVDVKPDYFSIYSSALIEEMEQSTREAQEAVDTGKFGDLRVNFACSLFRDDLYWYDWSNTCNAAKQANFKLFVTPLGDCSPVHYGAFPLPTVEQVDRHVTSTFSIGELDMQRGLLDIIMAPTPIPHIDMKRLNPFELMLALEIEREEQDLEWGLPLSLNPYHTRNQVRSPSVPPIALESMAPARIKCQERYVL